MKSEFLMAINQLSAERDLPVQVVLEAVEAALVSAYKRDHGAGQNVTAKIDVDRGTIRVFVHKQVAETVDDERTEIALEEARKIDPEARVGQTLAIEVTPNNFGRIAAQTAKQVIMQRIREAERERVYAEYAEKEGEIVIGTVRSVGDYGIVLSLGKAEAHLPRSEQIPGERYRPGDRIKAYVTEVEKGTKGVKITVSRTHRNMLKRLLELEVPEIFNGIVEVKAIAREPGSRSKVAVTSLQPGVDPVGSCVGMRGVRIQNIVNELNGEKIDVVEWSPDVATFIANALSPAKVLNVLLDESTDTRTATVIVPENQLSLAIGREGQNARLAARLTGWRIDIKSATEAAQELLKRPAEATKPAEPQDLLALAEALLLEKSRAKATVQIPEPVETAEEEVPEPVAEEAAGALQPEEVAEVPAAVEEALTVQEQEAAVEEALTVQEQEAALAEAVAEPVPLAEEVSPEPEEAEAEEEEEPSEVEPVLALETALEPDLDLYDYGELEGDEEGEYEGETKKKRKKGKKSGKKRRLVYDEEMDEIIVQRVRKPSRRKEWEEFDEI
ncbi:MAG: transcription termination factor NusA [Anaerolineae bacterium]